MAKVIVKSKTGELREFNTDDHGKKYKELAAEFCETNGWKIVASKKDSDEE